LDQCVLAATRVPYPPYSCVVDARLCAECEYITRLRNLLVHLAVLLTHGGSIEELRGLQRPVLAGVFKSDRRDDTVFASRSKVRRRMQLERPIVPAGLIVASLAIMDPRSALQGNGHNAPIDRGAHRPGQ